MCRGSGAAPNDAMAEAPDDGEDWDAQFDAIFDNVRGLVDNDSLHDSDSVTTMSPRLEAVYDCSPAGSDQASADAPGATLRPPSAGHLYPTVRARGLDS